MKGLTERQREVLDYVRWYMRKFGVAPSRSEIAKELGVRNASTIDWHLSALMRKGWVELKPGSARFIRLLKDEIPLCVAGPISAGQAMLAEERVVRKIPVVVAEMFSSKPDYFVEVRGDSMNRLGVVAGTVVAVQIRANARNGEVVVARVSDEVTLKRYYRIGEGEVELRPDSTNPEHERIKVDLRADDFEVVGVVVGALIENWFQEVG